ncbi:MAG: DUF2849 domain-containing protein [Cohaesibacteraceae bacterium]|nr:DUF2849 domain-containing protein [Cohaesibacteraceae bacterium]
MTGQSDISKVITANMLEGGLVVYRSIAGGWCFTLAEAAHYRDDSSLSRALDTALQDVTNDVVVDVYALDVVRENTGLQPRTLKEKIRSAGPTVRVDLGKQAETGSYLAAGE